MRLLFPGMKTLSVIAPAAPDPFLLPVRRLSSLLQYSPYPASVHRVHVRGRVTLSWPGQTVCIVDDSTGLCIQTADTTALSEGDLIDVAGFLGREASLPAISAATLRLDGNGRPVRPVTISPADAFRDGTTNASTVSNASHIDVAAANSFNADHNGELVRAQGTLVGRNHGLNGSTFLLSSEGVLFTVVPPTTATAVSYTHLVVAMVAGPDRVLYMGAFGHRESDGPPLQLDSIFRIASMTKAVTTVAALQLVEQGKVSLDEPVARHLPQFKNVQLLAGFDAQGEPILGPAVTPPTLRHLLTHTSGLCYDMWDPDMFRYTSKHPTADNVPGPLIFEPGTRWQYGQGLDWTGRLVETVSGLTLEDYFQQNICTPLGMADTSFIFPADKFERLVTNYHRNESGDLQQDERKLPTAPKTFGGGGGLYLSLIHI